MTKIYLLRHSQPFRKLLGEYNSSDVEQVRNEKNVLSVYGEKLAREISERKELQNSYIYTFYIYLLQLIICFQQLLQHYDFESIQ